MKNQITHVLPIPEGVHCDYSHGVLSCKKGSAEMRKSMSYPGIGIVVGQGQITLDCKKGNKKHRNVIMTFLAHLENIFAGLNEKYIYKLETCNVHFPITLKVQNDHLLINNFLGEKTPRVAKILPGVHVEVKGAHITVSSHDKDLAGQTAANLEKAAKVTGRDRRIYQDGIYIVEKPGRKKE